MRKRWLGPGLAGALLAGAVLVATAAAGGESRAQEGPSVGVDADVAGNTATSLGPIDSCLSVKTGNTFEVDIFVADISDLLAWEAYFVYDGYVLNVADHDASVFLAAAPGSLPRDFSEPSPDSDGLYRLTATDLSEPPVAHSGSGVLARVTLEAIGPGISPVGVPALDLNDDGTPDIGPFLRDVRGNAIDDADGDGFFDGPVANAQIAVDSPCPAGAPPPITTRPTAPTATSTPVPVETATATAPPTSAPPSTGGDDEMWTGLPWVIGYVALGAVAILAAAAGLLAVRRRRAG